ncbi:MAG: hypothetical protein PHR36_03440 [Patescibacteria group bacterium]|nr:hypothetical protein [Patescibacteria group bacterium]
MDISYFLIILYILLAIIIAFSLIFLFFSLQAIITILRTKVPFARTPDENIEKILAELKKQNIPANSLIYDLGCGDGRILFTAERHGYRAIGYELSLFQYLKGLIKKKLKRSKVEIIRKNFMEENLGDADVIFTFLVGKVMPQIGEKLRSNLKRDATVISYGFTIPDWPINKILNTKPSLTYIYRT